MMFWTAASEHHKLTNREITLEKFQSTLCDHNPPTLQTDRKTDDIP